MKKRLKWRHCLAALLTICGCSSSGMPPRASEEEATAEESRESPTSGDSFTTLETIYIADGAVTFFHDASSPPSATSTATSVTSVPPSDAGTPPASTGDASVIEQPTIEEVTFDALCDRITTLEGRIVDVDLADRAVVGDWFEPPITEVLADASVDAGVCGERFAAYVVPCRGSVLVASSPTFVFGEGPLVGGEHVGLGCAETGCQSRCYPELPSQLGLVRLRVGAVVNASFDEQLGLYVGDVRINGADIRGIAALEVLELP